ncbi:ArnT family glycosyltransferase [Rhizobium sp. TRM95796]|uniref:ArnT family glycosyltransferase n=1 Tax=Rhizobium sp. TRM95796 TaxID=2979862 RepID=UPI0021E925E4|nr:glycosyltransferase family 39 protein [Rhizobium sp. TRM95796]MCV3765460.1 glycosyltransferase family 39 protein [Rhizobium sp. TRM95796]
MTVRASLVIILAVTVWRIVWLAFDRTDLFVDEAQYWLWSQHLDFGYYSKPPMIAWIIAAVTGAAGSSDIVWIRLCGPLLHAANALMLMAAARRVTSPENAAWVGASYIAIPAVTLSAYMFSTDVPLIFFIALTLWAYLGLTEKRSVTLALVMGLGVGCAFLSKYALLFLLPGGALALLLIPQARIAIRDFAISVVVAALVAAPNLLWNLTHGGATVKHTEDIARWNQMALKPLKALEFFGAQLAVMGPILFAALLYAGFLTIRRRAEPHERILLWLSLPVVGLITLQALIAKAEANWAASAYAAGAIVAVMLLARLWPRGLTLSLALTGAIALAFPILPAFPEAIPFGLVKRNTGRAEVSLKAAELARAAGLTIIVSDNRDMLADLFHTLRDSKLTLKAQAPEGFPENYYEQTFPYALQDGAEPGQKALFLTRKPLDCAAATPKLLVSWTPETGYYRGRTIYAYETQAGCLQPRG